MQLNHMRLTLHQLHVFQTVAKFQSVTIAARHLHMTQPAVSNVLRQLQDYYECHLINTVGRKLYITEFGEALLKGCLQIEDILDNTKAALEKLNGGLAGTLKVAIVSTAKYFMPRLLGAFKQSHTNIHIKLSVCNRGEILHRLQQNFDDFIIMSHPPAVCTN